MTWSYKMAPLVAVVCLLLVLSMIESFSIQPGAYTIHFLVNQRTSPSIKHSYVANLQVSSNHLINDIHYISESHQGDILHEYRSPSANSNDAHYVTYHQHTNGTNKCHYVTRGAVSHDELNGFLSSLVPYVAPSTAIVYDDHVASLLKNKTYTVYTGMTKYLSREPLLLFVDQSGVPRFIIGQFLNIQITRIEKGITINIPDIVDNLRSGCMTLNDEMLLKKPTDQHAKIMDGVSKLTTPWFLSKDESCHLPHIRSEKECGPFKKEEKVCIFLHGSGERVAQEPTETRTNYWGNVHEFTPQCSKRLFIWENTKDYGWDNHDLQKAYCKLAALHNETEGPENTVIKNTIVFSHSMGNLILAAGIKNGYCSFDDETSSWYAVDSPYDGSPASTKLMTICHDYYYHDSPSTWQKVYGYIAETGGYCIPGTGKAYDCYVSVGPGYCDAEKQCIDDLDDVIHAHVKGALCGLSSVGLASKYSVLLEALSTVVGYGESNDGMVSQSSCEKYHVGNFQATPTHLFYSTSTNHADGTCRNGNGWFSDGRKPCSWYTNKV